MSDQTATILLVDDHPANLMALDGVLAAADLNLVRAGSGHEALQLADEMDFAAILLDVRMPGLDGLATARRLRQGRRNAGTPIVLLTAAEPSAAEVDEGYAAGAIDFMSKPFSPEQLRAKVRALVEVWEQSQARAEIAESRAVRVLETMPDGLLSVGSNGRCTYANSAAERMLGRPRAELVGRPVADVVPTQAGTDGHAVLCRALAEGVPVEFEHYHPPWDRWFELRACPAPDGEFLVYLRDVTARKRAEEALRRSQHELLDFLENASEGLHWVGPDGTILWANQAELDLLGYSREEYIGRSIVEFHADSEAIADILGRLTSGEELRNYEARLRCKDGSIRHVLINSNVLRFEGEFIHTRCFTRDITERKRAEEALRAADRRKDEFLAMLAHELRNPLAPVLTAAEIFRIRSADDPILRKQSEVIDRQVRHMRRLLDDLLEVSRITRGKIELISEPVELTAVLAQAVETGRPLIEQRRHTLEVSLPEAPLPLEGDPARLSQVFTNLLNNAARYTDPGGRIWLTAARQGESAQVRVKDTGIGMTPEVLGEAFELFAQGNRGLDRSEGGLGIGLTLARELVEMHGGTINASSQGLNQGSEFVVTLPLAERGPEELPSPASPPLKSERPVSGSLGVLVVDDNQDQAEGLATLLRMLGHVVWTAHDGNTALAAARVHAPGVGILDIGLPRMDGYELARRLRQETGQPGMVLIAMTGYGREEDRATASEAGFDRHLTKPVDIQELLAALAECSRP